MYTGPYNASTVSANNWLVGPGVAPKADLYALKIFGCAGGTNEVIDAIEWAVDHNMDVINMSLGSPFGSADSPDAEAAENAAHDGVIVVTSSGNEGNSPYMTGTPGTGNDVISTAANDGVAEHAGRSDGSVEREPGHRAELERLRTAAQLGSARARLEDVDRQRLVRVLRVRLPGRRRSSEHRGRRAARRPAGQRNALRAGAQGDSRPAGGRGRRRHAQRRQSDGRAERLPALRRADRAGSEHGPVLRGDDPLPRRDGA